MLTWQLGKSLLDGITQNYEPLMMRHFTAFLHKNQTQQFFLRKKKACVPV